MRICCRSIAMFVGSYIKVLLNNNFIKKKYIYLERKIKFNILK